MSICSFCLDKYVPQVAFLGHVPQADSVSNSRDHLRREPSKWYRDAVNISVVVFLQNVIKLGLDEDSDAQSSN